MDVKELKKEANGRWSSIFRMLGINVRDDGKHGPCPICGGKDRFRFDDKHGDGEYYCSGCQPGDGLTLVGKVLQLSFPETIEEVGKIVGQCVYKAPANEPSISPELLRKIFSESVPAAKKNLVGQYLDGRGLTICPESLRYHKKCWDGETKRNHPAMLAVVSLPDGTAVTMHRTYLDIKTAGKAEMEKPKKLMPGLKKLTGGAIRLMKPAESVIGIAEGIETAIACYQHHGVPTWAAVNSVLLESFEPPSGIKKVYVFGDNDKNFVGQAAAYALGKRLVMQHKIEAEVIIPAEPGEDWLDVLNANWHI